MSAHCCAICYPGRLPPWRVVFALVRIPRLLKENRNLPFFFSPEFFCHGNISSSHDGRGDLYKSGEKAKGRQDILRWKLRNRKFCGHSLAFFVFLSLFLHNILPSFLFLFLLANVISWSRSHRPNFLEQEIDATLLAGEGSSWVHEQHEWYTGSNRQR